VCKGEAGRSSGLKYWEIITDNLSKAGWSWGCVSGVDSNERTIWIADVHRMTGSALLCVRMKSWLRLLNSNRRFAPAASLLDKRASFFQNSMPLNGFESGGGHFPR